MIRTGFIKALNAHHPRSITVPHYGDNQISVGVNVKTADGVRVLELAVHRDGSWILTLDNAHIDAGTVAP